jgi:hypothetical protein
MTGVILTVPNEALFELLVKATGATWAFYGSTMIALLGYIVFPKSATISFEFWPRVFILISLGLFFALNLAAVAGLQSAILITTNMDGLQNLSHGFQPFSCALIATHVLLDVSALVTTWLMLRKPQMVTPSEI